MYGVASSGPFPKGADMLAEQAKELGIKYFLVSFADLFGTQRAKLVPAAAIDEVCKTGAGFAGFATWLDMTPADPDIFAVPAVESLAQLPWKPEIGWLAADLYMNGAPLPQAPRNVLKRSLTRLAEQGYELRHRRRVRVLCARGRRARDRRSSRCAAEALLRPAVPGPAIRFDC